MKTFQLIILILLTYLTAQADEFTIHREVHLKEKAEVSQQSVCLNDLVEEAWLQSRCAVEHGKCCKWNLQGDLERTFSRTMIERDAQKLSFGGIALNIKGSSEVRVTQTHRYLTTSEIQTKLELAARERVSDRRISVSIKTIRINTPIAIPINEESDWDVLLPEALAQHVQIRIVSKKDTNILLGWAEATLVLSTEVYVAKHTIRPTDSIRLEDFELRQADVLAQQTAGSSIYRKDEFPESTRARLTILKGTPLTSASVERVPLVQLGDVVTLILRSDSLKISTKGVAQGVAAVGDMVTVQLPRYHRSFRGRLLVGRQVEVWL